MVTAVNTPMAVAQRKTWLTPALVVTLILWFACETALLRVVGAIRFGRLVPLDDIWTRLDFDPTVSWALPAAIGAALGVGAAVIAAAFNERFISFRSSLALLATGSLMSAQPRPFSDHAAVFAAMGAETHARSLCFAASGTAVVCLFAAVDAVRTRKTVASSLCFAATGALSLALGVNAALVHGALRPARPMSFEVQLMSSPGLGVVLVIAVVAGLALAVVARRRLARLARAFQCIVLALLLLGLGSWGREALMPVPDASPLNVVWTGAIPNSPWGTSLMPLLPSAARVVFTDTAVHDDGVILCEISRCTTEVRERFLERSQRLDTIGRPPQHEAHVYVFPSTTTSLTDLQQVILDARAARLSADIAFVRQTKQVRPLFGPVSSFEAGYLPGLADEMLLRVEPVPKSAVDRRE